MFSAPPPAPTPCPLLPFSCRTNSNQSIDNLLFASLSPCILSLQQAAWPFAICSANNTVITSHSFGHLIGNAATVTLDKKTRIRHVALFAAAAVEKHQKIQILYHIYIDVCLSSKNMHFCHQFPIWNPAGYTLIFYCRENISSWTFAAN